jgi:UDP-N-acetylglucosamine:LPS N-acetylglucosamine transferase
MVQETSLHEDLPETLLKLNAFMPFDHFQIKELSEHINRMKCQLIICDISPMGIVAAQTAHIPSILIENFTWDWIYEGYEEETLNEFIAYLQSIFAEATCHIQTQPICKPAAVDFTAGPASRKIKTPAGEIRRKLKLSDSCKVVMITAGGVPKSYEFMDKLKNQADTHFIIPGTVDKESRQNNLILLPKNSAYFHPDLINASDAVIGKAGYGTIAEIYQAGVPFGYCARTHYRESKPLIDFIENKMHGFAISESEFHNGNWTARLKHLLALPRTGRNTSNGGSQMAEFIRDLMAK